VDSFFICICFINRIYPHRVSYSFTRNLPPCQFQLLVLLCQEHYFFYCLLCLQRRNFRFFKSWKDFIPASIFLSIGIFTWYDAVSRIGASKESLLSGPMETITILLIARLFLHERLNKVQFTGVAVAITGLS